MNSLNFMSKIKKVWSREILDSRAVPTVETAIQLDDDSIAVASVPILISPVVELPSVNV